MGITVDNSLLKKSLSVKRGLDIFSVEVNAKTVSPFVDEKEEWMKSG